MIKHGMFIGVCALLLFSRTALAGTLSNIAEFEAKEQPKRSEKVVQRPRFRYEASNLRDPFKSYIKKEEPVRQFEDGPVTSVSPEVLPAFEIKGIIIGGIARQVIINDKILSEGDSIEGARITEITKSGVLVVYKNYEYSIRSPAFNTMKSIQSKSEIKGGVNEKK